MFISFAKPLKLLCANINCIPLWSQREFSSTETYKCSVMYMYTDKTVYAGTGSKRRSEEPRKYVISQLYVQSYSLG